MDKTQIYHLESEFIKVSVSSLGAELLSIFDIESSVEYLWQGNPTLNPRSPQIMFPIVGKLKEDKYRLGRKFFRMPMNGYLKDLNFQVKNHGRDRITLVHTSTSDTELIFPFRYKLEISLKVYGPRLTITFDVKNLDKKEMFFSLGFAPTLNIPIGPERLEDCYIELSEEEERGAYYLENNLVNFNDTDDKRILDDKKINFTKDTFKSGEMIFKDIKSMALTLKNDINEKSISISYANVPYLSLWSFPGANYVKVSPSFGVADTMDSNGDFYMKEGLIDLEQEKSFKSEFIFHIR